MGGGVPWRDFENFAGAVGREIQKKLMGALLQLKT